MYKIAGTLLVGIALLVSCSSTPIVTNMDPTVELLSSKNARSFNVRYIASIPSVPAGTNVLKVWLPVPETSPVQAISNLQFDAAVQPRITRGSRYGNKMAYFEILDPADGLEITMRFSCTRKEYNVALDSLKDGPADESERYQVFLKPDTLVVIDDRIRAIASRTVAGKRGTVEKARAIYDYVLNQMTYDKSVPGWGMGSTVFACDVGKGNCTDFHSLFNSLCRASGIASGFEIGLYLPYDKNPDAKLGGYHCWASFRVPGRTWVPVDISEADKNAGMAGFFFGGQTSNRVTLSTGRDIELSPRQAGKPLNYFIDPYAEADGSVVETAKTWSYTEAN